MKMLPVDMRLAYTRGTFDGAQNVCAKGKCQGDQQYLLLSWYVFPPACRPTRSRTGLPPAPCVASGDQLINRKVLIETPAIGGVFSWFSAVPPGADG